MCYKLDRSLLGLLVAVMLVAPPAQALNDDVAVQLLERLNDLEGEVTALRGENESLKDKLEGAPTREDEEAELNADAQKLSAQDGISLEEQAKSVEAAAAAEPQISGVNIIVEDATETNAVDPTDIPSLEQEAVMTETVVAPVATESSDPAAELPAQTEFLTTSPVDSTPALLNADAATVATEPEATTAATAEAVAPLATSTVNTAVSVVDANAIEPTASTPVVADNSTTTPAPAPAVATTATVADTSTAIPAATESAQVAAPVDPKSKDSYYYYGTPATEKAAELKPVAAGVPAASTPALPDANSDQGRKAKADYNQAYQLLVSKPAEAVPLFRSFLANYPQHELAANAQYWLAEALYAQKDFDGASQEFMKVLKQYKDSPKSSGAALKLGYSFYELQQWEYARRTLEDTVRFFPDSSSSKLAEARLQKMKNEGH